MMEDNAGSFLGKVIDRITPYSKRGIEGLTALVILIFSMLFCYIFYSPTKSFEKFAKLAFISCNFCYFLYVNSFTFFKRYIVL